MSTDIKPGQVWAYDDNHAMTATVHEVRGGEVWATSDQSGSKFVRSVQGFLYDYHLVPPTEPPAPLDPSKVKAGDTVTLERDGGRLPDQEVMVVSGSGMGYTTVILRGGLQVYITGPDAWTLTAHQPAPEPEPEWKPGTVADISTANFTVRASYTPETDDDPSPWVSLDTGTRWQEAVIANVRPLVVIDPAAVDWRRLQSEMSVLVVGAEPFKRAGDILDVVRRELGIEAS